MLMGQAHEHMLMGLAHEHVLMCLAREHMLMGLVHEHMHMGQAHEHMLMGLAHERVLVGLAHEHMLMGADPMRMCSWDRSRKHMLIQDRFPVQIGYVNVHFRIGYVPSILMGPKSAESEERTQSDLPCHLIHGLYPVGMVRFQYLSESQAMAGSLSSRAKT